MRNFQTVLQQDADTIHHFLLQCLSDDTLADEQARPSRLMQAVRHGTLNGGKRLRPFLVLETARLFGCNPDYAIRVAASLECVHCYSLIHDDLPAMDNDDLRRGQPTVHKRFDDATAILAGDALLTFSFDLLADPQTHPDGSIRSELVLALSRAAGMGGMVGGQMLDIQSEGYTCSATEIRKMQAMKTGALIRYGCLAGAILGEAEDSDKHRLLRFGEITGLAFQLADDILDMTATEEELGKTPGKDNSADKATLVSLNGLDDTRVELQKLVQEAEELLSPLGDKASCLIEAARFIANRKS